MGAKPYAVVDCLNFGNPETPEILWQFKECIRGMSDIAAKFESPVISGNVSFYNETEGIKINPTPAVGVIGVEKLSNIRTLPFKEEGDKIIIIGKTYDEVEGSEYHRAVHNLEQGDAPKIRIDDELASANTILDLIENDGDYVKYLEGEDELAITATHDVSAGGIAIALSEMAMSGKLGCGENLTAQKVSNWVQNVGYGTVIGCNVGTSTGITSNINPDEYVVFAPEDIHIIRANVE
jgi:phosphoribosylformylglycinamidine synthase